MHGQINKQAGACGQTDRQTQLHKYGGREVYIDGFRHTHVGARQMGGQTIL